MRRRHLVLSALLFGTLGACRGCECGHGAPPAAPPTVHDGGAGADASGSRPYLPTGTGPDAAATGPLSLLETELFARRPQLNGCYRLAAKEQPDLAGEMILSITIGPEGRATDVSLESDSGLGIGLTGCVISIFKASTFRRPPDGATATVKLPLTFHPPADAGAKAARDGGGE